MAFEAAVVLALLLVPGLLADGFYRFALWRADPEEHVRLTRAILFSAVGLAVLATLSLIGVRISLPSYIAPDWWEAFSEGQRPGGAVLSQWVGHTLASLLAAAVAVWLASRRFVAKAIMKLTSQSLFHNAWHEFAARYFRRWVFVRLADGREFYGRLGIVSGDETRDLVLWNPCLVDRRAGTYEIAGLESIYVPPGQLVTVTAARDQAEVRKQSALLGTYRLETGEKLHDREE